MYKCLTNGKDNFSGKCFFFLTSPLLGLLSRGLDGVVNGPLPTSPTFSLTCLLVGDYDTIADIDINSKAIMSTGKSNKAGKGLSCGSANRVTQLLVWSLTHDTWYSLRNAWAWSGGSMSPTHMLSVPTLWPCRVRKITLVKVSSGVLVSLRNRERLLGPSYLAVQLQLEVVQTDEMARRRREEVHLLLWS